MNPIGREELRDLAVSTAALGAAFAILFMGGRDPLGFVLSPAFLPAWIVATVLAALSFLPHEMAHRVTARAFRAYAEFRMWLPGTIIAVLSAFLGAVVAAPGGIELYTKRGERYGTYEHEITVKDSGLIALVGPLMNLSLAVIFSFAALSFTVSYGGANVLVLGARLNSYLAIFNMLPFYPMDGYKVLRWNAAAWAGTIVLGLLTFLLV